MKVMNREVKIKPVNGEKLNINTREYFPFRDVTYILGTKKAEDHGLYMPSLDLAKGMQLAYKHYCNTKPVLKDLRMNKVDLVLEMDMN